MTKEEKARAYDEVLRVIKECNPDENGFITIYPQEIFPELKESEDERIRKAIIEGLRAMKSNFHTISSIKIDDAIAWLEKQGEQKQKWGEEDESRITTICIYLQDYARLSGSESRTIRINEYCDWLKSLKDRVQPKQEWSEEDETELTNTIIMLKEGASLHFNKKDITKAIDWLESLRTK